QADGYLGSWITGEDDSAGIFLALKERQAGLADAMGFGGTERDRNRVISDVTVLHVHGGRLRWTDGGPAPGRRAAAPGPATGRRSGRTGSGRGWGGNRVVKLAIV